MKVFPGIHDETDIMMGVSCIIQMVAGRSNLKMLHPWFFFIFTVYHTL